MQKVQWKIALLITISVIIVQFAESKNVVAFPVRETLWADGQWLPLPNIPIASSEFLPVTADQAADHTFIYTSYQPYEEGLLLRVEENQPVVAKNNGMVLFTGDKRKTGKTMTVAYDSGDTVTYGFLHHFDFLPYTRFTAGDVLGQSSMDLFYIHHDNDTRVLDPESLLMWLSM